MIGLHHFKFILIQYSHTYIFLVTIIILSTQRYQCATPVKKIVCKIYILWTVQKSAECNMRLQQFELDRSSRHFPKTQSTRLQHIYIFRNLSCKVSDVSTLNILLKNWRLHHSTSDLKAETDQPEIWQTHRCSAFKCLCPNSHTQSVRVTDCRCVCGYAIAVRLTMCLQSSLVICRQEGPTHAGWRADRQTKRQIRMADRQI